MKNLPSVLVATLVEKTGIPSIPNKTVNELKRSLLVEVCIIRGNGRFLRFDSHPLDLLGKDQECHGFFSLSLSKNEDIFVF